MTKKLYEVSAKGERIPEASPNSTCKTWRLITALYHTTSVNAAETQFKKDYAGEYIELLPGTKEVPESHPIYKQFMELNADKEGDGNVSGTK